MQLSGYTLIENVDLYNSETNASHRLGQMGMTADGRKFRYAKAGGVTLVTGNLLQSPARSTDFTDLGVAAAAVGDKTITVTLGSTAATANMFAQGQAVVSVTPGLGQIFTIASHPAADASATLVLTLEEPVRVALTTSSKITLHLNDYNGVVASPTTRTGKTVGVATYPIPTTKYGWIQTGGPSAALSDATVAALGEGLSPSTSTAGSTTKAVTLLERIGTASLLQVSGKVEPIYLEID